MCHKRAKRYLGNFLMNGSEFSRVRSPRTTCNRMANCCLEKTFGEVTVEDFSVFYEADLTHPERSLSALKPGFNAPALSLQILDLPKSDKAR